MNSKEQAEDFKKSAPDLVEKTIQAAQEKLEKEEPKKEAVEDIDKELDIAFDKQLEYANKMIDGLGANSLKRLFKYHLAFPFKHNESRIVLKKDEQFPNDIFCSLLELKSNKIKNMILEDIRKFHEEQAEVVKDSHDRAEEFEKTLEEKEDAGTDPT